MTQPTISLTCPTDSYIWVYDGLFLTVVCLLSAVPYVTCLGLYNDDWQFWADYNTCADHSLMGLFKCSTFGVSDVRPIWRLYIASMFWLFGNDPVGAHLVMLGVSMIRTLLLYLTLRELRLSRPIVFTVPLIYALLPHYSAARFWIASSQADLSMVFYIASVYCAISALRSQLWKRWCWGIGSLSAMLASTLSYEVAMPLFILTPVLLWFYSRLRAGSLAQTMANPRRDAGVLAAGICGVIAAAAIKGMLQTRSPVHFRFLNRLWSVATQAGYELVSFNFGKYGFGMPLTVWRIVRYYPDQRILVLGAFLTIVIFLYLSWILRTTDLPSPLTSATLAGVGIGVFGLAYALWAAQPTRMFTTIGLNNRVAIAGALGTAILEVGVIGWLTGLLTQSTRAKRAFCVMLSVTCGSGFLVNSTLASFWISASRSQQQILADIRAHFLALPKGSTFLLDGVCTSIGPGPIFATKYDLAGALQLLYRDNTIRANVVTPSTTVENGYLKFEGDDGEDQYPYQRNLLVYDWRRKESAWLVDVDAARGYFGVNDPRRNEDCASQEAEPF